jgi:hypothetical protein
MMKLNRNLQILIITSEKYITAIKASLLILSCKKNHFFSSLLPTTLFLMKVSPEVCGKGVLLH